MAAYRSNSEPTYLLMPLMGCNDILHSQALPTITTSQRKVLAKLLEAARNGIVGFTYVFAWSVR